MTFRREEVRFGVVLAAVLAGFFAESLFGGKLLSPADVLRTSASFGGSDAALYEPANRLLMDPVLQFQPWLELNRAMLRAGRLPLWNPGAGCGAPHLANGQSAVFDPFHVLAYLGTVPDALAWMAALRLWVAGLGMFLLARSWGLGPWGRWFAGLTYPFCGFLVVWLLFPVTSVAVWMPWLFWTTDRVLERPRSRSMAALALIVGFTLLGGHVQTSAHVLLASGLYVLGRVGWDASGIEGGRRLGVWGLGVVLGVALAAIQIVPLGFYLSRSPVWGDRETARPSIWALERPRLLDAACTALPYLYGSQRQGHPNLARALGVHNLNESAGGFAGLAPLIWLAPVAYASRRRVPRVRFLTVLAVLGFLGAFELPPVANLLRALPVLNVTDNRRLTLWIAFSLVLLGGIGLDRLSRTRRGGGWNRWVTVWVVLAIGLVAAAVAVGRAEPALRAKAQAHYGLAAARTPGAEVASYHARAERQVRQTVSFVPRYLGLAAAHLLALAGLATALRRGLIRPRTARAGVFGLTLLDVLGFGLGLNPAIPRAEDRPEAPVIAALRRGGGDGTVRVVAVGAELPPNTLMRFGLADARNYDSVELARSLAWFAPLYEPGPQALTSRSEVNWSGVRRARDRLRAAGVTAVVGASPPPEGLFDRVERAGQVWIGWLEALPLIHTRSGRPLTVLRHDPGAIEVALGPDPTGPAEDDDRLIVRETFDPGWRAEINGQPVAVAPECDTFLAVPIPRDPHARIVTLRYDPIEVRVALAVSLAALAGIALAGWRDPTL